MMDTRANPWAVTVEEEQDTEPKTRRFICTKRDYWSKDRTERPYQNIAHTAEDARPIGPSRSLVEAMLGEFDDGAILEITVVDRGSRHAGVWQWVGFDPIDYTHGHMGEGAVYRKVMDLEAK